MFCSASLGYLKIDPSKNLLVSESSFFFDMRLFTWKTPAVSGLSMGFLNGIQKKKTEKVGVVEHCRIASTEPTVTNGYPFIGFTFLLLFLNYKLLHLKARRYNLTFLSDF